MKNSKNQDKPSIKSLLKEILYNSLAQSIIRLIITPHLTLKLFLAIFVLGSSGMASFLVLKSIMFYFTFCVSTSSRTIYENPTLFPKVTFCNVNLFTTEYAYNLTQANTHYSQISLLSSENKKKLGHNFEDILMQCWFNDKVCNTNDFVWSFDENYGNCYTFNAGFDQNGSKINLK